MTRQELINLTSRTDVVNVEVFINMGNWMRCKLQQIQSPFIKELWKSWNVVVHALSGLSNEEFDETIKNLDLYKSTRESMEFECFLDDCHN